MITTDNYLSKTAYEHFSGTITLDTGETVEINDDNIVLSSVVLTESCCNNTFGFGAMITNQLDIGFLIESSNPFLLNGSKITLDRQYFDSDDNLIETIPLGIFYTDDSSIKRKISTITLTAYDISRKLDTYLPSNLSTIITGTTPYGFIRFACLSLGIPLATTEAEAVEKFPNCGASSESFKWSHTASENITYRQMVCAALQLMGAFGRVNRYGKFEIKQFDLSEAKFTVNADNAISRSTSDLSTPVTGVQGDDFLFGSSGFVYNLTGNLIVTSWGTGSGTPTHGRTLYELSNSSNVVGLDIYSAEISWFGDLAVEPGDCFLYTQDGLCGGDRNIIVMETIWKPYGTCTLRSYCGDTDSGTVTGSSSQSGNVSGTDSSASGINYVSNVVLGGLKFVSCTANTYAGLTPDSNTVYYVSDQEKVTQYLGSVEISGRNDGTDGSSILTKGAILADSVPNTVLGIADIEEV